MPRVAVPKAKKDARRRSLVWRFFQPVDSGSVRCLLCRELQSKHGQGSTTNMLRHLRVKHPTEIDKNCKGLRPGAGGADSDTETDGEHFCSVEVALEDGDTENPTIVNESDINGTLESALGGLAEQMTHEEASANCPVTRSGRKRSLIWRYFDRLDCSDSARCHICMKAFHCCENGSTSNLRRHMSKRHPDVFSKLLAEGHNLQPSNSAVSSNTNDDTSAAPETVGETEERVFSVEVEDGESDNPTPANKSDISVVNGSVEATQQGQAEQLRNKEAHRRDKRILIWKHFEHLESLNAARCRICMKKLQCFESGGVSNLRRHMSNRHPEVFSSLLAEGCNRQPSHSTASSDGNDETWTPSETVSVMEQTPFSGSRLPDRKERVWSRERELIEALRRAQKEEARALEHQRELLEKLQAAGARAAAAEREKIELLRKVQQEEAKDLSRQREELQKEKTELQKRWKDLKQEKEKLLLVP